MTFNYDSSYTCMQSFSPIRPVIPTYSDFIDVGDLYGLLLWDRSQCAPDTDPSMPEGQVDDIGRFSWLGVIQHSFMLGGEMRYAVTTGVLIHPSFVLAPATDIAKIPPVSLRNSTNFVLWQNFNVKYALDVKDYSLHPEFSGGKTLASVALLELFPTGYIGVADVENPTLPICLNLDGIIPLTELYAIQVTDVKGEIAKVVHKMRYVSETDCDEFYNRAGLGSSKMKPSRYVCAVSELQRESCVWDAGTVLVTRQSWGYWKLIGFGVRGAGCGAPARFAFVPSYLQWIDDVVSMEDALLEEQDDETHKIYFRRLSPVKLAMYKSVDTRVPTEDGQCSREARGQVLFKEGSEILISKNFVQGFYFVSVAQLAQISCAIVAIDSIQRTNAAVWVEHHCHREVSGADPNQRAGPDMKRLECFMFFKSKMFLEVRFFFSFKALIEITMYGREEKHFVANPYLSTYSTEPWAPTARLIKWGTWWPYGIWESWL
ncbi:hypothetical protein evm_008198 [Chilo suppressalis]|nr:hypothetical protein evm_008198 [Chilo suppressalis]